MNTAALLRRELNPFFSSQEVKDGSFVMITKYQLTQAAKLSGDGEVWCRRTFVPFQAWVKFI